MSSPKGPPVAEQLTQILNERYLLAHTPARQPFAVRADKPSVMIDMLGKDGGLREALALEYWDRTGNYAGSEDLSKAMTIASAVARRGHEVTANPRVGVHAGLVYLDLGYDDGRAVEIGPGGWRVVQQAPVVFCRSNLTGKLPLPANEGSMARARDLLNIADHDAWALYTACRVASLLPGLTHPVELMTGLAGSAKTTVTRMTYGWIDPAPAMASMPENPRDWVSSASNRYVVPVDNVSGIPVWWSDLLCKAVSGDGHTGRSLYTNNEIFVASFRSVIILNGITLGQLRGDLADRVAWHQLTAPAARWSDTQVTAMWERAHPEALAWLLDWTCYVMRQIISSPPPAVSDRLVDFSQVLRIIDAAWGTNGYQRWQDGRTEVLADIAEGDTVAMAVQAAVRRPVQMTPTELLAFLQIAGSLQDERGQPWTPRRLSDRLTRCQGSLEALGYHIERRRTKTARLWVITPPEREEPRQGVIPTPRGGWIQV